MDRVRVERLYMANQSLGVHKNDRRLWWSEGRSRQMERTSQAKASRDPRMDSISMHLSASPGGTWCPRLGVLTGTSSFGGSAASPPSM